MPDYRFPSSIKPSISEYESRKTRRVRRHRNRRARVLALLLALGIIAVAICHFYIVPVFVDPMLPTAEAAEVQTLAPEDEIRQNDYYCNEIAEGRMRVDPKAVTANQLLALCAEYL